MVTWTSPTTWVAGYVTSVMMNAQVRDNFKFLISKPRCSLIATSTAGIGNGTYAVMTWVTEVADTDSMWAVGQPTRIYLTTAGTYRICASAGWAASGSGVRLLQCNKNSGGSIASGTALKSRTVPPSSGQGCVDLDFTDTFIAGDYIEIFRQQTSGGSLAPLFTGAYDNAVTVELVSIP